MTPKAPRCAATRLSAAAGSGGPSAPEPVLLIPASQTRLQVFIPPVLCSPLTPVMCREMRGRRGRGALPVLAPWKSPAPHPELGLLSHKALGLKPCSSCFSSAPAQHPIPRTTLSKAHQDRKYLLCRAAEEPEPNRKVQPALHPLWDST